MNRRRIKLLVTLVLLSLAATSAGMVSQADARGQSSPGASSQFSATRPDAAIAAGEPDAPTGVAPPPPPTVKQLQRGREESGHGMVGLWTRWTGRIWATLYLKAR